MLRAVFHKHTIRNPGLCQIFKDKTLNVKTQMYKCDTIKYLHNIECQRYLSVSLYPCNSIFSKPFSNFKTKAQVKVATCLVYEQIADNIDYVEFVKYFKLPDSFQSWFLAVALHVWMCITVTISEKQGRLFRTGLIDSMWNDVEQRIGKLHSGLRSTEKKKGLKDLVEEFRAALISFDEGILSNDMVLAAAVWRMFFSCKEVDPRLLEDLVFYIRRQIDHLDSLHMENLLKEAEISFLPLNDILKEKNGTN